MAEKKQTKKGATTVKSSAGKQGQSSSKLKQSTARKTTQAKTKATANKASTSVKASARSSAARSSTVASTAVKKKPTSRVKAKASEQQLDTDYSLSVEKAFGSKGKLASSAEAIGKLGEKQLLAKLIEDYLTEQRARRRWGIVFKLLAFTLVFAIVIGIYTSNNEENIDPTGMLFGKDIPDGKFVAVVEIKGLIADGEMASSHRVIENLRSAVNHHGTEAVILDINSGGGSATQSASIYREINLLRENNPDTPIYAVISDIGASGAYYIASSSTAIFADPTSLVGSIGVIYAGFGFTEAMKKYGIDRRVLTAGENKSTLDPFSPLSRKDQRYWKQLLDNIHEQFIEDVKNNRPELGEKGEEVFSGLVYDGKRAFEVGLIDGFGDIHSVAREQVGNENLVIFDFKAREWRDIFENFVSTLVKNVLGANNSTGELLLR